MAETHEFKSFELFDSWVETFLEIYHSSQNPKEMAHHILEQVLAWTGREPADDMTVIVVGMWEICDRNTLQARMDSV